ncbi:MAG TPA: ACT domain-containing protein [Rubrobacter sp.]|nr:ACT domain-containing protein [Rubrobacter sp.]
MNAAREELRLSLLAVHVSVCRLDTESKIPDWAVESGFFSVTRTTEELSVVCPEGSVPEDVRCEGGWRVLKLEGPFGFSEVGVLVSVAGPLAGAGVSVFAVSTYDTDYVLVKEEQLRPAVAALRGRGHEVS